MNRNLFDEIRELIAAKEDELNTIRECLDEIERLGRDNGDTFSLTAKEIAALVQMGKEHQDKSKHG